MVELEQRLVQKREPRDTKKDRLYLIDIANEIVIKLQGITEYKWKIYEPLLDALRTTRTQTETGEIQTTPITRQEVKSFFPEKVSDGIINNAFQDLNKAMSHSGWSVDREGRKSKIPIDAPWYLSGPDENGDQKNGQATKSKQEDIYVTSVNEQRKRIAEKHFDRIDYGTKLLHSWLTHHTNPNAKKFFTTNLEEFMSNYLPPDLKLDRIIGKKTSKEAFQELIGDVLKSMEGKTYEELPEIQKPILPMWNSLKKQSGQHPKTIILESFSTHDSNNTSLNQTDDKNFQMEEVILIPKPIKISSSNKVKVATLVRAKDESTSVVLDDEGNKIYGLYKAEREILRLLIIASKEGPISRTNFIELCKTKRLTKLKVLQFYRYLSTIKNALSESLYYIEISPHIDPSTKKESLPKESDYRFTKKPPITSARAQISPTNIIRF